MSVFSYPSKFIEWFLVCFLRYFL